MREGGVRTKDVKKTWWVGTVRVKCHLQRLDSQHQICCWKLMVRSSPLCCYKENGRLQSSVSKLRGPVWTPPGGSRLHCNLVFVDPTERRATLRKTQTKETFISSWTWCRHILTSHLAYVGHFHEGLVGLAVLVQLQSDISSIWRPFHVKNPQSHQTGNQSGVMCRVQKQLPVWERILRVDRLKTKHQSSLCKTWLCPSRGVQPVWLWWGAL